MYCRCIFKIILIHNSPDDRCAHPFPSSKICREGPNRRKRDLFNFVNGTDFALFDANSTYSTYRYLTYLRTKYAEPLHLAIRQSPHHKHTVFRLSVHYTVPFLQQLQLKQHEMKLSIIRNIDNRNKSNKRHRNVTRRFCRQTHIHGFSEVARSKGVCVKFIWLAVILACVVGAGFEILRVFRDFKVEYAFCRL